MDVFLRGEVEGCWCNPNHALSREYRTTHLNKSQLVRKYKMQNTVEVKFNKFRLMFIRYLGQYKETNNPFSYLLFGSTILHLGHLQFYIVAISGSGQERLYTAIVMALLWLWSIKDFDFGVRCLIQSYIFVLLQTCVIK